MFENKRYQSLVTIVHVTGLPACFRFGGGGELGTFDLGGSTLSSIEDHYLHINGVIFFLGGGE